MTTEQNSTESTPSIKVECTVALEIAQEELAAAEEAEGAHCGAGNARTILEAAGYLCSRSSDSERVILAVTSTGDDDEAAQDVLAELREILGPDYEVVYTGDGNTGADGCTTDDVRVELTDEAFSRIEDELAARTKAAEAVVESAREALADSDEPRTWILREEGHGYSETVASSAEEALEEARGNVDRSNYSDAEGTIWIDVDVRCEATGEELSGTVQLDEDEPECEDGEEHDWQSPHGIVGGIESNPGVWGSGGGVVIHECCMRCGCARITDTWAQRPDTGEQGLRSVSYEPGKYADEIPTREMREIDDAMSGCSDLLAGAAYVLAELRGEPSERCLRGVRESTADRAREVAEYLARVGRSVDVRVARDGRGLRLALRLATVGRRAERVAAEVISEAMGWGWSASKAEVA